MSSSSSECLMKFLYSKAPSSSLLDVFPKAWALPREIFLESKSWKCVWSSQSQKSMSICFKQILLMKTWQRSWWDHEKIWWNYDEGGTGWPKSWMCVVDRLGPNLPVKPTSSHPLPSIAWSWWTWWWSIFVKRKRTNKGGVWRWRMAQWTQAPGA